MTDPAVQAVAEALSSPDPERPGVAAWVSPDRVNDLQRIAQLAVDAYRQHVRDSRPDAERWPSPRLSAVRERLYRMSDREASVVERRRTRTAFGDYDARWLAEELKALLDALADADAARQAAEADRDRLADWLHTRNMHPDYEYEMTKGPRKQWDDADEPPEGDGWERNITAADHDGWERFDYHEESYWRRQREEQP